jgi:transposase
MSSGSSRRYPPELRERAVRMVAEISDQHDSEWAAISEVARLLGVGCAETVRKWVRQAQVDAGARPGTTTEESADIQPSVGAVGSSCDNALAETINGLYKTELIKPGKPWRSIEDVELATARWIDWFNPPPPLRILR